MNTEFENKSDVYAENRVGKENFKYFFIFSNVSHLEIFCSNGWTTSCSF